jgi:hypothetical protein
MSYLSAHMEFLDLIKNSMREKVRRSTAINTVWNAMREVICFLGKE